MPDSIKSRGAQRQADRKEAGRSGKAKLVAQPTWAADPQDADSCTATSEQSHRPWLVPGAGKL